MILRFKSWTCCDGEHVRTQLIVFGFYVTLIRDFGRPKAIEFGRINKD